MIAHVGRSIPPTQLDFVVARSAAVRLGRHGVSIAAFRHDIINLDYGRDFLAEAGRHYEGVILYNIFHFEGARALRANTCVDPCIVSTLHTLDRWRDRLAESQASWVAVMAITEHSLSGLDLGDIDGYTTVHDGAAALLLVKRGSEV
jgi:hypothetical protein